MFRTRTITQAAILAARVGLLTNAPLTKADILVGSSRAPTNRVVTSPNAASMRRLIKMRNVALNENDLGPRIAVVAGALKRRHSRPQPHPLRLPRRSRAPADANLTGPNEFLVPVVSHHPVQAIRVCCMKSEHVTAFGTPTSCAIEVDVLKVFDGDGIRARVGRTGTEDPAVRFIDAPEMDQPGGVEARDVLKSLVGDRESSSTS